MSRLTVALLLILTLSASCKKSTNDPAWERSFGAGNAMFIKATSDSGLISCGQLDGKPYIIKLDKDKIAVAEYKSLESGLYSYAMLKSDLLIAVGSSNGKMLISCIDKQSNLLWDTTLAASYLIDITSLCTLGNGDLLALGSASPDSSGSGSTGLCFVRFNTGGLILDKKEVRFTAYPFVASTNVVNDNSGNFYFTVTKKSSSARPMASIIKYNSQLLQVWERELFNNPTCSASSLGVSFDNSGDLFVSGKTELPGVSGITDYTFAVRCGTEGAVKWKEYPELTNSGTAVLTDETGMVFVLNVNCFRINILNPADGATSGFINVFDFCDSKNTDALGRDFDFNYDGNIIMAGSKGGGFYLAMKSPVPQKTQ